MREPWQGHSTRRNTSKINRMISRELIGIRRDLIMRGKGSIVCLSMKTSSTPMIGSRAGERRWIDGTWWKAPDGIIGSGSGGLRRLMRLLLEGCSREGGHDCDREGGHHECKIGREGRQTQSNRQTKHCHGTFHNFEAARRWNGIWCTIHSEEDWNPIHPCVRWSRSSNLRERGGWLVAGKRQATARRPQRCQWLANFKARSFNTHEGDRQKQRSDLDRFIAWSGEIGGHQVIRGEWEEFEELSQSNMRKRDRQIEGIGAMAMGTRCLSPATGTNPLKWVLSIMHGSMALGKYSSKPSDGSLLILFCSHAPVSQWLKREDLRNKRMNDEGWPTRWDESAMISGATFGTQCSCHHCWYYNSRR